MLALIVVSGYSWAALSDVFKFELSGVEFGTFDFASLIPNSSEGEEPGSPPVGLSGQFSEINSVES